MTEAIKPTPDGVLTLHFVGMPPMRYEFRDIKTHTMTDTTYIIYPKSRSRIVFPLMNIQYIELQYNSEEYIRLLHEWSDLDHPRHEARDELDGECRHCREILALRSQLEGGM